MQRAAFEVRIIDWSSDVCSSDLAHRCDLVELPVQRAVLDADVAGVLPLGQLAAGKDAHTGSGSGRGTVGGAGAGAVAGGRPVRAVMTAQWREMHRYPSRNRSEEHTSELQSLMRISYAVFCLKKKKRKQYNNIRITRKE